jgi:type VI secretion system VasI family protein
MIGLSILAASPAFAAAERCRTIAAEKERLACFDRAAAPAQGDKRQAGAKEEGTGSKFVDPVDSLKAENDKVSARLKGICRGC